MTTSEQPEPRNRGGAQSATEPEQLALVRGARAGRSMLSGVSGKRARTARAPEPLAAELPIARVAADVSFAHLDRLFDYAVPESMAADAVPGVRVRVRFAGRDVDGFLVERVAASDHAGQLAPLRRVVSAEPVLAPEVLRVARRVADHYAGTLADVLRLAVPPRHARVEAEPARARGDEWDSRRPQDEPVVLLPGRIAVEEPGRDSGPTGAKPASMERATAPAVAVTTPSLAGGPSPSARQRWAAYGNGPQLLTALAAGGSPRAVWASLSGPDPVSGRWPRWPGDLAAVVQACVASGRGALVVVADKRDVALVGAAFDDALGAGAHVALTAGLGPQERYRRWLAVRRAEVNVVVGTRSAAFAPVADLGLVAIWDDGDDLHAEPRAPYPHAREVLLLRAHDAGAAAIVGGLAVTTEGAELVRASWARAIRPARAAVRAAGPLVRVAGEEGGGPERAPAANRSRLPGLAFETARTALEAGPVLVQVPRAGYVPALACGRCHTPARCVHCHGPLSLGARGASPLCRWCGRPATPWRCFECGHASLRAPVVGAARTAEELGRAFPAVPVITSGGSRVRARVGTRPALVVATPGAEPVADGGYVAALLLDGWLLLSRADLRAGEETLRRWFAAAALVRPARAGGRVVLMAPPGARAAQALVRGDPFGAAERELADRVSAGMPPAARVASVTGEAAAVSELLALAALPDGAEVLGPVPSSSDEGEQRAVVRAPRSAGPALAAALHAALAVRSAHKSPGSVRVQVDPIELG